MSRTYLTLLLVLTFVVRAELCFRKIHGPNAKEPGTTVCRGLIEKEDHPTARSCCNSEHGVAYHNELVGTFTSLYQIAAVAIEARCCVVLI